MQLICKCFSVTTLSLRLHGPLNCVMGERGEYDPWK